MVKYKEIGEIYSDSKKDDKDLYHIFLKSIVENPLILSRYFKFKNLVCYFFI